MTTVFQRIKQLMTEIEKTSTKFISSISYYIVCITVNNPCINDTIISKLLTSSSNQPLAVYYVDNQILLIIPNREENESHFLEGDQQKLCSWYCNELRDYNVNVSIIEFISQTSLITYIGYKITEKSFRLMQSLLHDSGVVDDIDILPPSDIFDILLEHDIFWDDITEHDRYGTLYKLDDSQGEIVIVTKSEEYDARKHEEYCNFIFGA